MAAAAFTEVLDQFVEGFESREPAAAAPWHPGIATRSLFWFEGAAAVSHCVAPPGALPHSRRASTSSPLHRTVTTHRDAGDQKPLRRLTPGQRDALHHLVACGATLDAGFTREELRSAFRSLARAYHPDRHPTLGQAERECLARAFTSLREAYEVLLDAIQPSH